MVAKFVDAGVIDDRAFAQTKARSLHRRGTSSRLMRQKLKMAGVDGDTLDEAMVGLDVELDVTPPSANSAPRPPWRGDGGSGPTARPRSARTIASVTSQPWPAPASPMTSRGRWSMPPSPDALDET